MQLTAKQLCDMLQGKLEGDPDRVVSAPAKIEEAEAHQVSFIANPKYAKYLTTSKAGVLIINEDLVTPEGVKATLIRVPDAYAAITALLQQLGASTKKTGHEQPVSIAENAKVAADAYIGAFTYIAEDAEVESGAQIYPGCYIGKGAKVGANTTLYSGVKVYHDCVIGANCIIHSNVVIGGDGFGFAPKADGSFDKIPQTGNVVLEDNVEVGANSTIDRATMGSTRIGQGAKLDNLVMIAHNVQVGANTVIAAQAGISGSTKIGQGCMIGGQAGFVGHIEIADGVKVQAQSGVGKSVTQANSAIAGAPAFDYLLNMKANVVFKQLPELTKRVNALEHNIAQNDLSRPE